MTTDTDRPDDHEDDALSAAWRASSRESPPPALDAAILAAAHRAVGSAPRMADAEALRPPKWWLPFAAAAVIGVVAVSVVQLAPHHAAIDPSSGDSAKPSAGMTAMAPAAPPAPSAPASATTANSSAPVDAKTQVVPSATAVAKPDASTATSAADSKAKLTQQRAASTAAAERAMPEQDAPVAQPLIAERSAQRDLAATLPASPPGTAPAPAPAPARQSATAPAPSPPREQRQGEPMPFPAASAAKKENAGTRKDLVAQDRAAESTQGFARDQAQSRAGGSAPASPPPPAPALAASAEATAPGRAGGLAAAPSTAAPSIAPPSSAPRPAPAPAPMGMRAAEPVPSADRARETASGNLAPLAKQRPVSPRAEAIELAKDPDAWIIRIRKLRDGGRVDEATIELREFDALVPNAQQRMPSELRRFMEREGAK